jgi:hypothetical protein
MIGDDVERQTRRHELRYGARIGKAAVGVYLRKLRASVAEHALGKIPASGKRQKCGERGAHCGHRSDDDSVGQEMSGACVTVNQRLSGFQNPCDRNQLDGSTRQACDKRPGAEVAKPPESCGARQDQEDHAEGKCATLDRPIVEVETVDIVAGEQHDRQRAKQNDPRAISRHQLRQPYR